MGQQAWDRQGERAAIPYLRHAVELDSNFALAFAALASAYGDLGDTESATENATKAYALRDRVNGLERSVILTAYHVNVTGDLEQAAVAAEIVVKLHPEQSRSLNDLGVIHASLGHYDKATEVFRKALSLDQSEPFYSNLAISLMAIDRAAEAGTVLDEAKRRNLQTASLSEAGYWLAFLSNDRPAMQQIVDGAGGTPEIQQLLNCDRSITEAFDGRFEKAAQLALAAYPGDTRPRKASNNASAAECVARMAVIQAEAGQANVSRKLLMRASALSRSLSIDILTALADARNGDTTPALAIAKKLAQNRPSDTFIQHYWLPLIRAEIALNAKHPDHAIQELEIAEPYDFANPPEMLVSTLYPVYVRGKAYAMKNQPIEASKQFRELTDHPGMVLNFPLASMARAASGQTQGNPSAAQSPKP
jgi:tetratricopeptide (TPR) repeat protein